LLCFSEQTQQFGLIGFEHLWLNGGDFFRGVRSSHPDDGVIAPQTLHEFGKAIRGTQDELHNEVRASDRSSVAAFQQNCNRLAGHRID
jgi:hypothetical protein